MNTKKLHIGTYDFDDDIIEATRRDRQPNVKVYGLQETVIVLGQGSKPEIELHLDACLEDNIPVLKRRGGGCAVVIDPGNVIVSVALPMDGIANNRTYFRRLSEWLMDGLTKIGLSDIRHEGISDLVKQNKKVVGACIYCSKDLLYYSATLLVNPSLPLMADSFGVNDATGQPNTSVIVPLNITNVHNGPIQTITFSLDYNESVIRLQSIQKGPLISTWGIITLGSDKHSIALSTLSQADAIANGTSGTVLYLNFTVVGSEGDMTLMSPTSIDFAITTFPFLHLGHTFPFLCL